ncbi:Catalase-1 isoform B [Neolecta irregularis DAH-3]|uniref:Catalase n=1 Tax=Neolecta irregularis (strain DAH-3) TaxID=1198029 RepID=A0A1U7LJ61_NEOID|nr:Catalase-1 isoform A [Neolecta irregularis DAH-3]OLL22687.1 Catalase-1 isoform B [Neolecta irregularis DAH-3]|eukprot:OLL22686.1 Catalase-1 isoform A [Neolecta irregularis DAH-3]
MASTVHAIKKTLSSVTADAKSKQLAKVTVDATRNHGHLTTNTGVKVQNTDEWLKAGYDQQGPSLLEDFHAREKIQHFDHERMPERVVHARGVAAHGVFKLHESAHDVTKAKVLNDTSRSTPIFLRFSTVLGSRGSADTVRDVRGFAVRFYTDEGNWDIVGNNIPVFFIQDAIKFPDVIHAGKPEPRTEVPQAQTAHDNFWDFAYSRSESTHMLMWVMSDRAIPRSLRHMQGFGVNTYAMINKAGERNLVKFHFTPICGLSSLVWDEALKIAGQDPDFHRKDLYSAIESGNYPKWKFGIQTMKESQLDDFDFHPEDATKLWPEELFPIRYIGEIELNRNVDEYFPETEQVAFCTSHVVPGIDFSNDPLLQGRLFSYQDTQLNRFNSFNFTELPINKPICPVTNFQRDGFMRHQITKDRINYSPNRFDILPTATEKEGGYEHFPAIVEGIKARLNAPKFKEHYNQAELFYNSLAPHEQAHLSDALSFELAKCNDQIVYERMASRLAEVNYDLACKVATKVGAPVPAKGKRQMHNKVSPYLSQTYYKNEEGIKGRRIAFLLGSGYNAMHVIAMKAALTAAGANCFTVGPVRGPVAAAGLDKKECPSADFSFDTCRSTLFDGVFVPGGIQAILILRESGRAVHFIREAFMHLKPICAVGEGVSFLQQACELPATNYALDASSEQITADKGVVTCQKFDMTTEAASAFKIMFGSGGENKGVINVFANLLSDHRCWDRETVAHRVAA